MQETEQSSVLQHINVINTIHCEFNSKKCPNSKTTTKCPWKTQGNIKKVVPDYTKLIFLTTPYEVYQYQSQVCVTICTFEGTQDPDVTVHTAVNNSKQKKQMYPQDMALPLTELIKIASVYIPPLLLVHAE